MTDIGRDFRFLKVENLFLNFFQGKIIFRNCQVKYLKKNHCRGQFVIKIFKQKIVKKTGKKLQIDFSDGK